MAQAKALVDAAKGERVEFTSPVSFMNINFAGGLIASVPPWSEMVKYGLNTGGIVWRIDGHAGGAAEYNSPNNTGVQFPRNARRDGRGLIFLATGPERKVHAYDRDTGKELWVNSLPNGAEGMLATYQVNGRQFVVLPVARPAPRSRHVQQCRGCGAAAAGPAPGGPAGRRPPPPGGPPGVSPEGAAAVGPGWRWAGVAERVHCVRLAAIAITLGVSAARSSSASRCPGVPAPSVRAARR